MKAQRYPRTAAFFLFSLLLVFAASSCTLEGSDTAFPGQDLRMTFLHTTDTHSKVLPFKFVPNSWDEKLGILPCTGDDQLSGCQNCLEWEIRDLGGGEDVIPDVRACDDCLYFNQEEDVCPDCYLDRFEKEACYACIKEVRESSRCTDYSFGGSARVAWAIAREREKSIRSAHVDTGDFFQGAPIFNLFTGEAEVRALSAMGCDVSVIGNHEFDQGADRLADLLYHYATFPMLNANFMWDSPAREGTNNMGQLVSPFFIKNYKGLTVGYIGMGNVRSLNSLGDANNSMGARAMDTFQVLESTIPQIRNQVDLLVLLSHMGLNEDIEIANRVTGLDLIFGGHDHVLTDPPLVAYNPEGKRVIIVHSGVNNKAVGRLDVVVRDGEVLAYDFATIPITSETDIEGNPKVGSDPTVANILYDYQFELDRAQDLTREIGYAAGDFPRKVVGDSPLGNLVAEAIRVRRKVETDFSITNSLGIRADLNKGNITVGKMYEIFPFENSITTMYMSGFELQQLFDFVASKSSAYGCSAQVQISGAETVLDCKNHKVKDLKINGIYVVRDYDLKEPYISFNVATNDYIADGGSGFDVFEQNTTKTYTSLSLRDVVIEYIEEKGIIEPVVDGRIKLIRGSTGGSDGSDYTDGALD